MTKELKDRINKRKIAYIYLMHRMFEGNPTLMLKYMLIPKLTVEDLEEWDSEFKEAVYQTIQEEDTKGVTLRSREDVPSIRSIKEKVLRRCNDLIDETTDPAKLATVYKTLSEFEVADDKKEESVLDAITKTLQPRTPKKKESVTMLEKMRQENKLTDPGKRGPGRPRKVQPVEEEPEDDMIPEDKIFEGDTIEESETINE